jgi:hypothetical protein
LVAALPFFYGEKIGYCRSPQELVTRRGRASATRCGARCRSGRQDPGDPGSRAYGEVRENAAIRGAAGCRCDPDLCRHAAKHGGCRCRPGIASGPSQTGSEICHHDGSPDDGGNAGAPGSVPDHSSCTHCIFCLAGAMYALEAPLPWSEFHIVILTVVQWLFTVWRLPALTVDASARPRGPPLPAS